MFGPVMKKSGVVWMPWVRSDLCAGCGVCVNSCPVDAIDMSTGKAEINQNRCINCGRCFSACPQEAIRPNAENPELAGRFRQMPGAVPGPGPGFGMGRGMGRGMGGGGGFGRGKGRGRGGGGGRAMGR